VSDPEETCRSFVQIWAEAVMRQVERVRAIRKRSHSLGRAYEWGFGPDELDPAHEAEFEGSHAVPGLSGNRSLRKLPGERLPLFTGYNGLAFGLIDPGELERRALGVVATIEDELMERAADWWADMNSGR
jgi:hypothetical protein